MNNNLIPLALLLSYVASTGNIGYSQDVIADKDKVYSVEEGTAANYHFTSTDNNGSVSYYKININNRNLSSTNSIRWSDIEQAGDYTGAIEIKLPNDQTKTLYYGYNKPEEYTSTSTKTVITENSVYHKVFENINYYGDGLAIYNNSDKSSIDIISDFIKIKNSRAYEDLSGGAIYNGTSGKIGSIMGKFIKNEVTSSGASSEVFGGAICNSGTIDSIIGDFIENSASAATRADGGAIYNVGTINSINANFIGNKTSYKSYSGALYNSRNIESIKGNFIANYVSSSGAVFGSAITNTGANAKIENIASDFIGNHASSTSSVYGGAIANNSGQINTISGDFIGNSAYSPNSVSVLGGAIYNNSTNDLTIKNSNFIANKVSSKIGDNVKGGAIYTRTNLNIESNNGSSLFRGNYIQRGENPEDTNYYKDYQAIYIDGTNKILSLQAENNGKIVFDDKIAGNSTSNTLSIDGDNTSSVTLNNEVQNIKTTLNNTNLYIGENTFKDSSLDAQTGNIELIDDRIGEYNINKLTSSENVNYTIELDTRGEHISNDKLVLGTMSNGTVTVNDVRINGDLKDFKAQIIVSNNSNTQLELSAEAKDKFNKTDKEIILSTDTMVNDVNWLDVFNTYEQEKTTTTNLSVATTTNTNDSLEFSSTSSLGEKTVSEQHNTLALLNQFETIEDRNFNFNTSNDVYKVESNLGTTSKGTININGIETENERSTINGNNLALFVLKNESNLHLNNVKITNSNSVVEGSNHNANVTINNSELSNNRTGIKTAGNVYIKGNSIISNNGNGIEVTSNDSVIELDATNSKIRIDDNLSGIRDSKLSINNGTVEFSKPVTSLDIGLKNTNINLKSDNLFNNNNLTVNNVSNINMMNNSIGNMQLREITLNDTLNLGVDVDLQNKKMDTLSANSYKLNGNNINITQINLLNSTERNKTEIKFADDKLKNNVTTSVKEVAYSPIYKYGVGYNKTSGQFTFTRGSGSDINTFNPAILASPVAAQMGGYMGMLDNYSNAFSHMDMNMLKPANIRMAQMNANKYAISDQPQSYYSNEMNSGGAWFKPYVSYDSVNLKHGPKVNNMSYGSFIGGDTGVKVFRNGFSGALTPYIAYQGSHQSYSGNSIYQNGGSIGLTGTLYKGNFFTGLTVGVGANVSESNTMYGHDDFGMFMTGVASKTGYNFEFNEGKFIIQPSVLLSYTMVNAFNYTNSAGVKIHSDALNAFQISPNLKFVMNTKSGWQPYLTAGMNWNIMGTDVTANQTSLPDMYVKPYVQYGVGVQKTIGERLTAFLQVVLRNGGRNGIAGNGGIRYMLGKTKEKV